MSTIRQIVCDGCGTNGKEEDSNRPEGWISMIRSYCSQCISKGNHCCDSDVSLMFAKDGRLQSVFPATPKERIDFCSVNCLQRFLNSKIFPRS